MYLAVVIDLYNREVIGYAVSRKIDAEQACQALSNAIARYGRPKTLVFHSDRGCQYSSRRYQQMLQDYGIRGSMSKPGYSETKIDLASATGCVEKAVFDEIHLSVFVTYISEENYKEKQISIPLN